MTATLAAAAAQLQGGSADASPPLPARALPAWEEGTLPAMTAPSQTLLPPGSPATPWVPHFSAEAAAVAAALASSPGAKPASGCTEGATGSVPTTPRRRSGLPLPLLCATPLASRLQPRTCRLVLYAFADRSAHQFCPLPGL